MQNKALEEGVNHTFNLDNIFIFCHMLKVKTNY